MSVVARDLQNGSRIARDLDIIDGDITRVGIRADVHRKAARKVLRVSAKKRNDARNVGAVIDTTCDKPVMQITEKKQCDNVGSYWLPIPSA